MYAKKQARVCRLCGKPFFSNKRIYCQPEHCRIWNYMLRGTAVLDPLLQLLVARRGMGARIEGYWPSLLTELGWLESEDGFTVLTQAGWERLEFLLRSRKLIAQSKK